MSLSENEEVVYNDSPFFNNGILSTHKHMTSLLKVTEKSLQNYNEKLKQEDTENDSLKLLASSSHQTHLCICI